MKKQLKSYKNAGVVILGLLALLAPHIIPINGLHFAGEITLGIFGLAALFWLLEPIPVYATSILVILLQVFLLSAQGILGEQLANLSDYEALSYTTFYETFAHPIIILFMGGFALASASVKHGIDLQLTRLLLRPFGTRPAYVCLGLMLSTAILSAFMSNTATTAMMMTVVLPVVGQISTTDPYRKAVALSIPFAANIGGIATPIGTPPNAIALAALKEQGVDITFSSWMLLAIPIVLLMLLISWRVLLLVFPPHTKKVAITIESRSRPTLHTYIAYAVFGLTVFLWITEQWHGISSTMIAFIPLAALPVLGVLNHMDIRGFSWEVLWLVAGGISIGMSLEQTGVANWIVGLVNWSHLGTLGLLALFGVVGLGLAMFISHTVSATILVPLAIGLTLGTAKNVNATDIAINMPVLVITVGIIVSFAMVLPISTPPNAIAMSSGLIQTRDMARSGAIIAAIGFVATMLIATFYWPLFNL